MVELEKSNSKIFVRDEEILSLKKNFYESHLPKLKNFTGSPSFVQEKSSFATVGAREAAQRFILRNQWARFSQENSSSSFYSNSIFKRNQLYQHVHSKIDTGLYRRDSNPNKISVKQTTKNNFQPILWASFKKQLENDKEIEHLAANFQFNLGSDYSERMKTLTNLIRSKVRKNLAKGPVDRSNEFKIVVHLTVVPRKTTGLHISSRCLWNYKTDNAVSWKIPAIDCEILIVVFLCHVESKI